MDTYEAHREPCPLPTNKSTSSFWHTEPSPLLKGHRTTRELPHKADVVVIGSGITGTSVAYHLLHTQDGKGDLNVVMLEAREACWGATGRNGGHCQPLLFKHPYDPAIARFEYNNWLEIGKLAERIDCEFVRQPSIRGIYGKRKVAEVEEKLAMVQQISPDLREYLTLLTSKEDLERFRVPNADAALHSKVAARLWPYKLVTGLLEELLNDTRLHGTFNLQTLTPVSSIKQQDGGWLVETSRGHINATSVVLATNAYTSHLVPSFSELIVPCRGQMSALIPTASVSGKNRICTSMGVEGPDMDEYLIQRPQCSGEQLMFGGGRAISPSMGIADDSTIDQNVAKHLRTALPERMNLNDAVELKASHEWTGIMGWSRDGLPWVGEVPGSKGLYLSAGYTGHGMPNAWLCGKAIQCMHSYRDKSESQATGFAQRQTSLPVGYFVNDARIARARRMDDVEVQVQKKFAKEFFEDRSSSVPSGVV